MTNLYTLFPAARDPRPDLTAQLAEAEHYQREKASRHYAREWRRLKRATMFERAEAAIYDWLAEHTPALCFGFLAGLLTIAVPAILLGMGSR